MMKAKKTEATQTTKIAAPPMNLDAGRINWREAIHLFWVSVVGALVATLGIYLIYLVFPPASGGHVALLIFGSMLTALGLSLASTWLIGMESWRAYSVRLDAWNSLHMKIWKRQQGIDTTRTIKTWELLDSDFGDVLLTAISTHAQLDHVETPWSKRKLEGAVWLDTHRLGDVTDGAKMRTKFTELKLITGSEERNAGEWVPRSFDDVVQIVSKNWR